MSSDPRSFAKRLFGFAGLPLLSLMAPFMLLPIVARVGGVGGWAAIAVGQSVGAFAGVVISFGWTLLGPAKVASALEEVRTLHYGDSVISRVSLLLVLGPAAACLAYNMSAPGHRWEAALMAIAMGVGGLSPAWYAVGVGRPRYIAAYDVIPRLLAVAVAGVLLITTHELAFYPVALTLASIAGVSTFSIRVGALHRRQGMQLERVFRGIWSDRFGALTVMTAGAYSSTPIALVGLVAPTSQVASFASADKLYRVALYAVQALGSSFQGWVAEKKGGDASHRMRASLYAHVGLGIFGFAALSMAGAPATHLLFGDSVAADRMTVMFYGIAFLAVSINTSTGRHILVPQGRAGSVLASTAAGAFAGITAMIVLGIAFGGSGAAAGLAAGEIVVCLVQFFALGRLHAKQTAGGVETQSESAQGNHHSGRNE